MYLCINIYIYYFPKIFDYRIYLAHRKLIYIIYFIIIIFFQIKFYIGKEGSILKIINRKK